MAILLTSRGFRYPDGNQDPDVPRDIGNLAADADGQFLTAATVGALPAFGKVGRRAYVSATGREYLDIGTAWLDRGPINPSDTATTFPASPVHGQRALIDMHPGDYINSNVWQFIYQDAAHSPGAFTSGRWMFIGGNPLWISSTVKWTIPAGADQLDPSIGWDASYLLPSGMATFCGDYNATVDFAVIASGGRLDFNTFPTPSTSAVSIGTQSSGTVTIGPMINNMTSASHIALFVRGGGSGSTIVNYRRIYVLPRWISPT